MFPIILPRRKTALKHAVGVKFLARQENINMGLLVQILLNAESQFLGNAVKSVAAYRFLKLIILILKIILSVPRRIFRANV